MTETAERRCSCCSHAESVHTLRGCAGSGTGDRCLCPVFTPRLAREAIAEIRRKQVATLAADNHRLRAAARALLDALPRCTTYGCRRLASLGVVSHEPEACVEHATAYQRRECEWADAAESLRKAVEG